MSRLSLLFFGAAEDVPEAAETVTAGTASPHGEISMQVAISPRTTAPPLNLVDYTAAQSARYDDLEDRVHLEPVRTLGLSDFS